MIKCRAPEQASAGGALRDAGEVRGDNAAVARRGGVAHILRAPRIALGWRTTYASRSKNVAAWRL
jgi:hypothetical protein